MIFKPTHLKKVASALLLFLFSMQIGSGQSLNQKIATAYDTFLNLPELRGSAVSFTIKNTTKNTSVFESKEALGLPTASTLKVITSVTALDILGEDYRFKTSLSYQGEIDESGTLKGNIIITGTGDPSLGSDRFEQTNRNTILKKWVAKIKDAGIKEVQGKIIGDDSRYDGYQAPGGYSWSDLGNYYGAGLSSLNWEENKIGVNFKPSSIGNKAEITSLSPGYEYLQIINKVTTGRKGTGDQVYGFLAPYSNLVFLRGSYATDLKKTIEVSSPDPALAVANALTNELEKSSIPVSGVPSTSTLLAGSHELNLKNTRLLDEHFSPLLGELVYWFNKKSINLYGEALLMAVGKFTNPNSSHSNAARLIRKYWNQKLSIPSHQLNIYDGSGLSQQNRVTTSAMTAIMAYAKTKGWYATFYKSLPVINGIHMKSGTIGGVLGYTGYYQLKNGEHIAFSLLVNNYAGGASAMRQKMFRLLDTLKSY